MKMKIAKMLLSLGAVRFSPLKPFQYASGLKGPIYCDNRVLLSHIAERNLIIEQFIQVIELNKLGLDLVGGIATAGIPHAAFIADRLKCPMVYIRPKPKGHGKMNQVEGDFRANQKVLLFEDLVNQGASLEDAIMGTKNSQLIVHDCLCIVDYQTSEGMRRLRELGIKLYALTDFTDLAKAAFELKLIDEIGKATLLNWHDDPVKWSESFCEKS